VPRLSKDCHQYCLAVVYSAGKVVLDLGCGYGYGPYMLSLNAGRVEGIDEEQIQTAKARYTCKSLDFHQAEQIDHISGSQRYDLVVIFEVIKHVRRQKLLLQLVQRAFNGGHASPVYAQPSLHPFHSSTPYHVHELFQRELLNLVEKYSLLQHCLGKV